MRELMNKIYRYLLSIPTTASEDIAAVLGSFDAMIEKLDIALAKTETELDASEDRQEEAYRAFVEISDRESDLRDSLYAAQSKAARARDNIAALVGA